MPNPQLHQRFEELLSESPNFRYLPPDEQEEVRQLYANASDQTLQSGIELLEKDTEQTNQEINRLNAEEETRNQQAKQQQLKEKLLNLKMAESKQQAEDQAQEESLLSELEKI